MTVTTPDYRGSESYRSYLLPSSYTAKFNLGESRSATVPHEYGHMIGLKDEYTDKDQDRNGCIYVFYDGTKQKVGANRDLMSGMQNKTAQPERYCLTIAYAVVAIFAQNGIRVTALEIL